MGAHRGRTITQGPTLDTYREQQKADEPLPPLTFNTVDVETANANPASICEIGIVRVRDGSIEGQWSTRIDPGEPFNPDNISIHGMSEESVRGCPTFVEAYPQLLRLLSGTIVASHTDFDRVALDTAADKHRLPIIQARWLDSALIARRAWPHRYGTRGWSLPMIADRLGIEFRHHVAVDDARAAAEIVLRACEQKHLSLEDWFL